MQSTPTSGLRRSSAKAPTVGKTQQRRDITAVLAPIRTTPQKTWRLTTGPLSPSCPYRQLTEDSPGHQQTALNPATSILIPAKRENANSFNPSTKIPYWGKSPTDIDIPNCIHNTIPPFTFYKAGPDSREIQI